MNCVVYVRDSVNISVYKQYNVCAEYAKRHGYSIAGKVFDFDGKIFHEAVNKIIPSNEPLVLVIYSKETVFDNNDDYLFFRIYLERLGHKLIFCN